jgi:2-C-methyl-D-erythritol 4-phosphate cytidylyltransferase
VHISAIVVAAGRGTRMGTPTAKALLPIGGVPMVVYSLRTLAAVPELKSIVLVIAAEHQQAAADAVKGSAPWPAPVRFVEGGAERQDSVAAGLRALDPGVDLVIVHDAARPFVSRACVNAGVEAAARVGAAIVALPVHDTVKRVGADGSIVQTLDRRNIWLAQTPQVFRADVLRRAYAQAARDGYAATDDAALVERIGEPVQVVPGEPTNRKITTPDDLRWAEWYVEHRRDVEERSRS